MKIIQKLWDINSELQEKKICICDQNRNYILFDYFYSVVETSFHKNRKSTIFIDNFAKNYFFCFPAQISIDSQVKIYVLEI